MIFCFDLDGTLCTNTWGAYEQAEPFTWAVERVRALKAAGHRIVVFTARGSTTGKDWTDVTREQLERWGIPCDELRLGKPEADVYVDDRTYQTEAYRWGHSLVVPAPGADERRTKGARLAVAGLAPPNDVATIQIGRTFNGAPLWVEEHVDALLATDAPVPHDPEAIAKAVRSAVAAPCGLLGDLDDVVYTLALAASPHAAYLDVYEPGAYPVITVSCRPLGQPLRALSSIGVRLDGDVPVATLGEGAWPSGRSGPGFGATFAGLRQDTLLVPAVAPADVTTAHVLAAARRSGLGVEEGHAGSGPGLLLGAPFCLLPTRGAQEAARRVADVLCDETGVDVLAQVAAQLQ